jgi:WD40 repeat protein/tetratricopeptide (TPR) repeat protein
MGFWSRIFGRDLEVRLAVLHLRALECLAKSDLAGHVASAQRLCELVRKKLGEDTLWYAEGLLSLSCAMVFSGRGAYGLALWERAEPLFREHAGPAHPLTLDALRWRLLMARKLGDEAGAARIAGEFVAGCEAMDPTAPWSERGMSLFMGGASGLIELGDLDLAEPALRKYDEAALHHGRDHQEETWRCVRALAKIYGRLDDPDRAGPLIMRSLEARRRGLGRIAAAKPGLRRAKVIFALASPLKDAYQTYLDLGRPDLAEPLVAEVREAFRQIDREAGGRGPGTPGWFSLDLGILAVRLGRPDEAEHPLRAAAAAFADSGDEMVEDRVVALDHLGHVLAGRGDSDGAEAAFEEMLMLALAQPDWQIQQRMCLWMIGISRVYWDAARAEPGDEEAARRRERMLKNAESLARDAVQRFVMGTLRAGLAGKPVSKEPAGLLAELEARAAEARRKQDPLVAANWETMAEAILEMMPGAATGPTESPPPVPDRSEGALPDDSDADWDALAQAVGDVTTSTDREEADAMAEVVTVEQWIPAPGPSASIWTASWTPRQAAEVGPGEGPEIWSVGDVISGLYRVDHVRGGGMGLVYRVRHLGWQIDLAAKSPRPKYFREPEHGPAFAREAEAWMGLGLHPNVVTCFYVRTIGGVPRVFSEFVDGPNLAEAIRLGRPEDGPAWRLDVAIQLARALNHAHSRGLVHQDVKPTNVLVAADGTVKLCDFGLARTLALVGEGDDSEVSNAGMTPAYCSPEQENRLSVGRATDIWSFAATVLEMCLGRKTWNRGPDAGRALRDHLAAGVGAAPAAISPRLGRLLGHCLAHWPEDRPSGLAEVEAELVAIYRESTGCDYPRPAPKAARALADSLNNRGISLLDLGRRAEAEVAFVEALAVRPGHLESTYNLALLRWRAGSQADDDALDQLAQAAAGRPEGDPRSALLIALVHLERGDCRSALATLDEVTAPGPELASARATAEAGRADSRRLTAELALAPGTIPSACWAGPGDLVLACTDPPALFDVSAIRKVRDLGPSRPDRPSIFATLDPSGRRAMTCDREGFEAWDLATGRSLRRFESSRVYRSLAGGGCALGPDGRALLRDDEGVSLVDLDSGEVVARMEPSGEGAMMMARLALSGDGTRAADCDLTELLVWDLPEGRVVRRAERTSLGPAVALDRDGRHALTGGADCVAAYWEVDTLRLVAACRGHRDAIATLEIASDGRHGLSAGLDGTMRYWDLASGRCLRTFSEPERPLRSAGFDSTGARAVAAGEDGKVRVWNLAPDWSAPAPWRPCLSASGVEAAEIDEGFAREVESARESLERGDVAGALVHVEAARSRPGCDRRPEVVALGRALALRLPRRGLRAAWAGRTLGAIEREGFVRGIDIAADGRRAVTGGDDGLVRVWDLESGECLGALRGHEPGEIIVKTARAPGQPFPTPATAWSVAISPDGRRAASAGYFDRSIQIWDLERGTCTSADEAHKSQALAVAFSPDGQLVLSGGADHMAIVREAATGRILRKLSCPGSVVAVRWGPGGRLAYVLSVDRGVRAWDVVSDLVVARIEWPADAMSRQVPAGMLAMMMPDSNLAAKAYDKDEFARRARKPPTMNAYSMDLDAAGQFVLIGLWMMPAIHPAGGGPPTRMLQGQQGVVGAVALSPDGRHALTGGKDQVVRLWDVATGECLRTFEGHNSEVTCLRFSPDGTFALSGGFREVRVWHLDWDLAPAGPSGWKEAARPHLETFLERQRPVEAELPLDSAEPWPWEARKALARVGKPTWTEAEFEDLMRRLGGAGFGWLDREMVRERLARFSS